MSRILMTADAVGGVWTYSLELARALTGYGLATTIATMGPKPSEDRLRAAADIPGLEIVTSEFQLEWMDDPWADIAAAGDWLLDLEARVHPIIVHLNGFAHGALPWRAPVLVVGHSCVVSWHEAVGEPIDAARLDRYRHVVGAGLRSADWVVAPTGAMLGALQRHYGPLPRASVVGNGRDAARFPPAAKEPFVATAGRLWDRAKNVEALDAVAPALPWPVIVAGEGDAGAATQHLGQLSEREIASWLGRAAIFALPARYEPFGLLPLEAALAGCALVLGDIPSLREVWGDAADYVAPEDHDRLRAAIDALIASPARLAERALAARARAVERTPARMAQEYTTVYGCAAARTTPRECRCAS
ncbi:MAG: glycosyl transferase family 1 [Acidobacteria bacterium]|nr:glycosyl transferase family 1 [Acidobacteriota bacterium]